MVPSDWYVLTADEVMRELDSSDAGLTSNEALRRLAAQGPNELPQTGRHSLGWLIAQQFRDFMILVLLAAAVVSGLMGDPKDTVVILIIVVLNAAIGAFQAFRAERAVEALRQLSTPEARVWRDGHIVSVSAQSLVVGDVVLLEAGNIVPADMRLLTVEDLQVDESALTGESLAASKQVALDLPDDAPLAERSNLAFCGSLVTRGLGQGVVVATASDTEVGRIATLLHQAEKVRTPLQQRLDRFGRYLALVVLAICLLLFAAGLMQGHPPLLMFLTAVSLAVAAIPEALPAVVTIALSFGARRLIREKALVRNLPAVETLGSVTYICTDKTGTLTLNQMTVENLWLSRQWQSTFPQQSTLASRWLGTALALNNDITERDGESAGEPTEMALYRLAEEAGFERTRLLQQMPRLGAIPFTSERQRMSTLHQHENRRVLLLKGAPEAVLPLCLDSLEGDHRVPLSTDEIFKAVEQQANEGYRVLALAMRPMDKSDESLSSDALESRLTFLGLVGLIDPPREEAPQAVADCLAAGITPVMITGDHPGTAAAIACRLGIASDLDRVITGAELAGLDDHALQKGVADWRVYARVTPEQKLRIVSALQACGEFVAMTGDGVNDAPALKRAGIGVAMGLKGTDVAREAADMVLLDDNFATIVRAVKAGRRIFDNIRKFIRYTMSSNAGEIWTLFLAPLMGLPIPLLPIHILWINLVTDGFPGLAFAAEPAERSVMQRPPRPPRENIFAHGLWQHIIWVGLLIGGLSVLSQAWAISRDLPYWQTVVFAVLTFSQLFHALAVRSETESLLSLGLLSNKPMLWALLATVALQLLVIYVPVLNAIFYTQPLPLPVLAGCIGLASLVLVGVEMEKWMVRRGRLYGPLSDQELP